MIFRNLQHAFDFRHLFQRVEGEGQHDATKPPASAKQFKISARDQNVGPILAAADGRVRNESMGNAAQEHIRAYCFFPVFHIFIINSFKSFRINTLLRQLRHPVISGAAKNFHLLFIIN